LNLSALPYVVAGFSTIAGGLVSDALVRRFGRKWGRRALGVSALSFAGLCAIAVLMTRHQMLTVILLALIYAAITFQMPAAFGVSLDISPKHAGALMGLMNTGAQAGGLVGSVLYGYIVQSFQSYDAPFVPMAALLFLGALLWMKIDASRELTD